MRRAVVGVAAAAIALLVPLAGAAVAHPLGNFTVNRYAGVQVGVDRVTVDYVVDRAEIPTFQARDDVRARGESAWAVADCRRSAAGVAVSLGGRRAPLRVESSSLTFAAGAGGLSTSRVECRLMGPAVLRGDGTAAIAVRDGNDADRVGWREIVVSGAGTTLSSSTVPAVSVSARLTAYPADRLRSPPDVRSASARVRLGGAGAGAAPSPTAAQQAARSLPLGGAGVADRYTSLVSRQHVTVWFLLVAMAIALVLGGVHALAPGHGKTVLAAYLVGKRGDVRQAWLLGLTVTVTHTAGVLLLGLLLSASRLVAPERLYPWLTLASGAVFASIGVGMLVRAVRRRRPAHEHHDRPHDHDQPHDHPHEHAHSHGGMTHVHRLPDPADGPIGWRSIVPLGLAGGMVPTPSALVVLLGAIALGRVWLGIVLVLVYGVGMAVTLTGVGLALVKARGALERRSGALEARPRLRNALASLPVAAASVIVVAGLGVAARGAARI